MLMMYGMFGGWLKSCALPYFLPRWNKMGIKMGIKMGMVENETFTECKKTLSLQVFLEYKKTMSIIIVEYLAH
jgi:hypothetical protein